MRVVDADTGQYTNIPSSLIEPTSLTLVGAPTSGQHYAGETFIDSNGSIWACSASGTPGTWFAAGSGVELASAELSSDFALSSAVAADVTGLTITITAPARAFVLELSLPKITLALSTAVGVADITDSANVTVAEGFILSGSAVAEGPPVFLRARLPRTGSGAYAITPGNSYTFKARYAMATSTGTLVTNTGTSRHILRAVTC